MEMNLNVKLEEIVGSASSDAELSNRSDGGFSRMHMKASRESEEGRGRIVPPSCHREREKKRKEYGFI